MDIEYPNQSSFNQIASRQNTDKSYNPVIHSGNQLSNKKIAADQDLHALYRAHLEKKNLEEAQSKHSL